MTDVGDTAFLDQAYAARGHWLRLQADRGARRTGEIDAVDAPSWVRDAMEAMIAARNEGRLMHCGHLTSIQPYVVPAESPAELRCPPCHETAQTDRLCHRCGTPAGTASLHGGREQRVVGVGAMYSRLLCPPCADPTSPGGTFGVGR
ncbi:hypothetical protein [Kitasatospora sp. NPDC018619]|uniref:hypothetical protein n=1 Tax=unclassified Kitasatospora TaxID=2633591 RepID=UPI0037973A81